jgi:hypothetical protein
MPDDTHIDLTERIAALEQMRTAERDAALDQRAAGHPLPLDGGGSFGSLPLDGGGLGWG